MEDVRLK